MLSRLGGYRLAAHVPVPDDGDGFTLLSLAVGSAVNGLVVKALADGDLVRRRHTLAPFGTTRHAEWSPPALVLVGLTLSYLEPDPDVAWGDDRVRDMIAGIRALAAQEA